VEGKGTYSKKKRRITEPRLEVSPHLMAAARAAAERNVVTRREIPGGVVFVNRTAGWLVAVLLVMLMGAITYVGTSFFTRRVQFDRLRDDVRHLSEQIDGLREHQMRLERRLVQLETEAENRRER
jgi:hypothetical protein